MLVFARISNTFGYQALIYDIEVFSVLSIKHLRNAKGEMSTPYGITYFIAR
jgi:hypothetical protein